MRTGKRSVFPFLFFTLMLFVAIPYGVAAAGPPDDTPDRPHSQNMHLLGSSLRAVSEFGCLAGSRSR